MHNLYKKRRCSERIS